MEKPPVIDDVAGVATSYTGEIDSLIEKNSSWWYSVEGEIDEEFGTAIEKSQIAANRLIKNANSSSAAGKEIDYFKTSLESVDKSSNLLYEYYEKKRATKDLEIVSKFQAIVRNYLGKISSRPATSTSTKQKAKNFWMLRINGKWWSVPELQSGDALYFHCRRSNGPAADYDLFKKVQSGDEGLAYSYGRHNAVVFRFEITKELHSDTQLGEIISLQITNKYSAPIPRTFLADKINFVQSLESGDPIKLFELNQLQFQSVLSEVPNQDASSRDPFFANASIPDLFADVTTGKLKDQLGFERDYIALASVVAYKNFQPPLAIGLFGNWGSGKSFFMNKLRDQIQKFADSEDDKFCHQIVQINFNSWHYSDSNLWASLITKIFEDLEKRGKGSGQEEKLQVLFQNLNSSQELKIESEQQLKKVERQIDQLKNQQKDVESEITNQTAELKGMSILDIAKEVFKSEDVQGDINELKSEFDFVRTDDVKQIETKLTELETTGGKLFESVRILYSFRKGNFWVALLVGLVAFAGSTYLMSEVDLFKKMFGEMKILIAPFLAFVSQVLLYLAKASPDIDKLHNRLLNLKKKTEEIELRERNKYNIKRDEIQTKIQNAQAEESSLKEKIKDLELKKAQAQFEIDNIASGKRLVGFIEGRVSDQRYINSLGIISWIRKDFEELDFLLKQQYDARKLKELNRQMVENVFEVDRIILYIDDLDRCDVSVVVRVLEAIHLLLAFPLFVVVVGVDPRWMHNAIQLKYKGFISNGSGNKSNGVEHELPANDDHPEWAHIEAATSFDYLEKIFQIPFALKPIDTQGKRKLIASNLKGDNYEKEEVNETNIELKDNGQKGKEAVKVGPSENKSESQSSEIENTAEHDEVQAKSSIDNEKEMIHSAELLEVPEDEIRLMQDLSFLVGDSPRAVKRFINIYRIIRAHSSFQFVDDNKAEHYYAAMINLGVISSFPEKARDFFEALKKESDITPFSRFFQQYLREHGELFPIANLNEMDTPELREVIRNIAIKKFKVNLELVSRFSFRDISDEKIGNELVQNFN